MKQENDRNPYGWRKTEGEMSVSLTSVTVIFTLYQRCADVCCGGGEQADAPDSGHATWLTCQGHLTRAINFCAHTHIYAALSSSMYTAGANGTAVITARGRPAVPRLPVTGRTAGHEWKMNRKEDACSFVGRSPLDRSSKRNKRSCPCINQQEKRRERVTSTERPRRKFKSGRFCFRVHIK